MEENWENRDGNDIQSRVPSVRKTRDKLRIVFLAVDFPCFLWAQKVTNEHLLSI